MLSVMITKAMKTQKIFTLMNLKKWFIICKETEVVQIENVCVFGNE